MSAFQKKPQQVMILSTSGGKASSVSTTGRPGTPVVESTAVLLHHPTTSTDSSRTSTSTSTAFHAFTSGGALVRCDAGPLTN